MSTENIPGKDPAADSSVAAMLRQTHKKMMQSVDGMLPAVVISYNRTTNRATIAPAINMVQTNNQMLQRAPLANITVLALGAGDFVVTFPVKPGDTGWIEASDRDISLWLQAKGARKVQPNTHRIHSFSDGRFIPDALGNYTLPTDAEGGLCIQHKGGSTYLVMTQDKIIMQAGDGVWINGIRHDTHIHPGVQRGGSTTDGPVN